MDESINKKYMREDIIKIKLNEKPIITALNTLNVTMQLIVDSMQIFFEELFKKKITRKKFIKLLQSQGIQRNDAYKLVINNKEPYTYRRYYKTINILLKEKNDRKLEAEIRSLNKKINIRRY